jgi:hypothetical protein
LWPDVREVNFFSHFVFSFGEHLWRNSINFSPETALFLWSCLPFGAFVAAVRCFAYSPCVPGLLYLACVFHQSLLPCVITCQEDSSLCCRHVRAVFVALNLTLCRRALAPAMSAPKIQIFCFSLPPPLCVVRGCTHEHPCTSFFE